MAITIDELTTKVRTKALLYLTETWDETQGETPTTFPLSIVDFVLEYAINNSNFPEKYTETDKIEQFYNNYTNTLSSMCIEIFAKIGGEGQKEHKEGDISRSYDSAWFSAKLTSALPNYVKVIN